MTNNHQPWDRINIPDTDFNVLRYEGETKLPVFWGKDPQRRCLLIIHLSGSHEEQFTKELVYLKGLNIDLRQTSDNTFQHLVLTLQSSNNQDIFYLFCQSVISVIKNISEATIALTLIFNQAKRWKIFLSGKNVSLLSPEMARGLFGELIFLENLLERGYNDKYAIQAWTGPDRIQQDFILGNKAVEIKSYSGREKNSIRISSENQLETTLKNLFLVAFKITSQADSPSSVSLNDLVSRIEEKLTSLETTDDYLRLLNSYGYAPLPEYNTYKFICDHGKYYEINSDFPKIIRSKLQDGISNVSYNLELESIEKYLVDDEKVYLEE